MKKKLLLIIGLCGFLLYLFFGCGIINNSGYLHNTILDFSYANDLVSSNCKNKGVKCVSELWSPEQESVICTYDLERILSKVFACYEDKGASTRGSDLGLAVSDSMCPRSNRFRHDDECMNILYNSFGKNLCKDMWNVVQDKLLNGCSSNIIEQNYNGDTTTYQAFGELLNQCWNNSY